MLRIQDEKQNVGFGFSEQLDGSWHDPESGQTGRAHLSLEAEFPNVGRLARELEGNVDGWITLEGFAEHADVRGTIRIRLFSEDGVVYEMGFDDVDGNPHRIELHRPVDTWQPLGALTHMQGPVTDGLGEPAGQVELSLDWRTQLVPTLASLRVLHP